MYPAVPVCWLQLRRILDSYRPNVLTASEHAGDRRRGLWLCSDHHENLQPWRLAIYHDKFHSLCEYGHPAVEAGRVTAATAAIFRRAKASHAPDPTCSTPDAVSRSACGCWS